MRGTCRYYNVLGRGPRCVAQRAPSISGAHAYNITIRGPIRYRYGPVRGTLPLGNSSLLLRYIYYTEHVNTFINPRRAHAGVRMLSEGYGSRSVCLFVCLSTTILGLQATGRLMSDTNIFSATRARKLMWRFC